MATVSQSLLFELGANVASLTRDLQKARSEVDRFAGNIKGAFNTLGAAIGVGSFGTMFKSMINAAAEAEKQEVKLAAALKSRGVVSKELVSILVEQAKRMQETTIFSDEEVMRAQRFGFNIGVLPSQMDKVIKVATQMAMLYDMDLKEATQAVSLAMEGNARVLRKIDPQLAAFAKTAKTSDEVLAALSGRFSKGVADQMDTYSSKVKMMENQWDEFKEAAGIKFLPIMGAMLSMTTDLIKNFDKYMPGEFQQDTQQADAMDTADMLDRAMSKYGDPQYLAMQADKSFIKRTREPSKEYANALKKLEKELLEAYLKEQQLYWGKHSETALVYQKKISDLDIKEFEKAGMNKDKIAELRRLRNKALEIESTRGIFEQEKESRTKIYDSWKKNYDEQEQRKQEARDRELAYLQNYSNAMKAINETILQQALSDISNLSPELANLMKTMNEQTTETDIYSKREKEAEAHWNRVKDITATSQSQIDEINQAYTDLATATEEKKYKQMEALGRGYLGTLSGLFDNLYKATGSRNEKLFRLQQAAAVAETIVSTYSAAMEAQRVMQKATDSVGAGFAAAAAVTVAGMAKIAAIMSANPHGGGGMAVSGGGGVVATATPEVTQPEVTQTRSQSISINVYGSIVSSYDEIARDMIPYLLKAQDDGVGVQ